MIKEIVRDEEILAIPSTTVRNEDSIACKYALIDLLDTAMAHSDNCLGLAAVQIGVHKKIIVVRDGQCFVPMINPVITWENKIYETKEEGCLSLEGTRPARRSTAIEIAYQPAIGARYKKLKVGGLSARVIQHEIDHLKGVLI